ncbi:MAG: YaeQ family protein [Gammaproteobacteria bacterium]|nr:YaeQ family protein [Gammaproteobacteria bacterium]
MALKATIYKATVNISDLDTHYYNELNLTIAQHPSESDKRMMVRLVAYILNVQERLEFTKGLSEEGEPEIWAKNYTDDIELWIELGRPDEARLRKASHKSKQVIVYTYDDNASAIWWKSNHNKLRDYKNLSVFSINDEQAAGIESMIERTMQLQATIEDGQLWLSNSEKSQLIEVVKLQ